MKRKIPYVIYAFYTVLIVLYTSLYSNAQNQDISLLHDINKQRNASLDKIMVGVTNSVYPVSGIVPLTELIIGYTRHDKKVEIAGWQTIAGLGVNTIITFGLKNTINRKRPYNTYSYIQPYQHDIDPSFPSGHTSFSFCDATSVSLCYPKWYVIAPSYIWAATVGYSRMYLGMHYPTDVLAGAIVGTGSAWLAYKGNRWLQQRKNKRLSTQHE